VHTEDIGGVLPDHMDAFASHITDGPCGLGIHIPFG
jgi:hypothetical protein